MSRVGYCQAAPSQPVPETEMLHKLYAIALEKVQLWPTHLFAALDACKLVGKGLLICAVDARGSLDTDARLQTPIATEPLLAHFFKQLRDNCHVKDCIKQFRIHLPRRAAAAYQFVPTEVWKGSLEQDMVDLRIPRQSLKATNAVVKLVWFLLPPGDQQNKGNAGESVVRAAVLEMLLVRPGATLPRHFAATLREDDKAAMWEQLSRKDTSEESYIGIMMGFVGIDPAALQEEPLYQQFESTFIQHMDRWFDREESQKALLMEAWCPSADAVLKAGDDFNAYLFGFFDDNAATILQLRDILGWDGAVKAAQAALAHFHRSNERQDRYTLSFHNEFARPCPACGEPLHGKHGYPCGCQRPVLPSPGAPTSTINEEKRVPVALGQSVPTHRRSKNIQTSFNHNADQPASAHRRKSMAAAENAPARQPTSAMVSSSIPARRCKRIKELDPAMVRLRETVRSHDAGGSTPLEALAAKHHQRRHGRKGRRRKATAELHPTDGRAQAGHGDHD